jgi:polyketide synthase PksN
LDHDRPYIAPKKEIDETSVVGQYAKAQMADFVHLNKAGEPIMACEVFQSLVEHFERWGKALDGTYGLCMLEVMMLDVPTTRRFMNDCVSFHFDIVQCLSRQYMISPAAFAMGGAMAGLLPRDYANVQTYPEMGKYCRVMNQHLFVRPFKIRFATEADLPALERLETLAWAESMRATAQVLKTRLETSPTTCLVCEMKGEVLAVLYMQRVDSVDVVDQEKFMEISKAHKENGRILQLIALAADPAASTLSIGSELRAFAIHLARVDPSVDSVIGVTRCSGFENGASMQEYVDNHVAGKVSDPTVGFHTSYGARVVRVVPDFRPEDTANGGTGVLIQYQVKDFKAKAVVAFQDKAKADDRGVVASNTPTVELLSGIMTEIGYSPDPNDLTMGFFSYGMDSLELVRVRDQLGALIGRELGAGLLFDFPNVQDLANHLDIERGLTDKPGAPKKPVTWDEVSGDLLVTMGRAFEEAYRLEENQRRFQSLAEKFPDKAKYLEAVEPIFVEIEGPIMVRHGPVEDDKPSKVRKGRTEFSRRCKEVGADGPSGIGTILKEVRKLTKHPEYAR